MSTQATEQDVRSWTGVTIPQPGRFTIDKQHTVIGFTAKHMMVSKVRGRFAEFDGSLELADDPTASSIAVTINAGSISTGVDDRDGHLKSPDFLDVENHEALTFESTEIRHVGGGEFVIVGDLTIRAATKPVELKATFEGVGVNPWGVQVVGFSASTEIDREEWGLTWNAALETGGVLVGKTIKLEIEAEFNPAQ